MGQTYAASTPSPISLVGMEALRLVVSTTQRVVRDRKTMAVFGSGVMEVRHHMERPAFSSASSQS